MSRTLAVSLLTGALAVFAAAPALADFPEDPPNDPVYDASPLPNYANEQWDLASPGDGFDRGISVDRAWRLSTGEGAIVADIDVGVEFDHADLVGQWARNPGETGTDSQGRDRRSNGVDDDSNGYVDDWRGWDFYGYDSDPTTDTNNAHGVNVAGVLSATADNSTDIAGIAPDARIIALRTSDNILHQGVRLAQAIVYAADRGATAISMSLGADSFGTQLRRAVSYANRRGSVPVVAIGNEFHFHHHLPQMHDGALAVGGINPDTANLRAQDPQLAPVAGDFDVHASYSNRGPHLDVVAPTQIPTTQIGGGTILNWSGTSAATPHVSGVLTLIAARARQRGIRLTADELIQIVRMSADDLDDPTNGYEPGWDLTSGWGRVNALAAVRSVRRGRIPPVADITAPEWYRPARETIRVAGEASGRSRTHWKVFLGEGEQPSAWDRIASGSAGSGHATEFARTLDTAELDPGGYTLRMTARDADGNRGADRAFFYALDDEGHAAGFPKRLGTSGESSPALADLDGRRGKEIVLATADGKLHVLAGRGGDELAGWPRRMRSARDSGPTARRIGPVRSGFLATPAIGDIAGGRAQEIVAAGLDGRVYAWTHRGRRVQGFPFRIDLRGVAEQSRLDGSIYASPALADLAGDSKLEVVFGAADQRIYALRGDGRALAGWPVLARDGGDAAKILSSPAVGDIDGDGHPDVVEGTAEAYGSPPDTSGRVYAFDRHGEPLPGWPVEPPALAADSIPLAGEGVPDSPSLADVDSNGDLEVAVAAFTGQPELYDGDGTRLGGAGGDNRFQTDGKGPASPATAPSVLALGANSAFGRLSDGGPLRFFGGVVDSRIAAAQASPAAEVEFEHLVGGWDAASGAWLPAFPQPIEGWQIPSAPAIADIDSDGAAEVIAGSSGNVLHAFSEDGSEPAGWPKLAGGWVLASPAVGDVDGDGRQEVVAVTRDGYLHVWNTPSTTPATEWPSFRHDRRNTGSYGG